VNRFAQQTHSLSLHLWMYSPLDIGHIHSR
jgi:hypothetical protein